MWSARRRSFPMMIAKGSPWRFSSICIRELEPWAGFIKDAVKPHRKLGSTSIGWVTYIGDCMDIGGIESMCGFFPDRYEESERECGT